MSIEPVSRRDLLLRLLAGGGVASLAACGFDPEDADVLSILDKAEALTQSAQRALLAPREALAPEYAATDISSYFKPNGTTEPDDPDYQDARDKKFQDWRLEVGGLVERPLKLSLALRSRATIASRDGAASRNGRARGFRPCSMRRV